MSLKDDQLAKVLSKSTTKTSTPLQASKQPRERWDPRFDAATEALYGKRWTDEDVPSVTAMRLRKILSVLGGIPSTPDLLLVMSVIKDTRSEILREKAYSCLAEYLRDAETNDYKNEIADLLSTIPMPGYWTPMPVLIDKTRQVIEQHKTK